MMVFENNEFRRVRTITRDGEPWFVGKDVAEKLGYQNSSKAIADHVDDDDKLNNESLSSLGQRGGWLINESGLYSLVLSSKLPKAKAFKRWMKTGALIPSFQLTIILDSVTVHRSTCVSNGLSANGGRLNLGLFGLMQIRGERK